VHVVMAEAHVIVDLGETNASMSSRFSLTSLQSVRGRPSAAVWKYQTSPIWVQLKDQPGPGPDCEALPDVRASADLKSWRLGLGRPF